QAVVGERLLQSTIRPGRRALDGEGMGGGPARRAGRLSGAGPNRHPLVASVREGVPAPRGPAEVLESRPPGPVPGPVSLGHRRLPPDQGRGRVMKCRGILSILLLALALLAAPLAAEGQQAGKVYRVGFLGTSTASLEANLVGPFREGLRDLG